MEFSPTRWMDRNIGVLGLAQLGIYMDAIMLLHKNQRQPITYTMLRDHCMSHPGCTNAQFRRLYTGLVKAGRLVPLGNLVTVDELPPLIWLAELFGGPRNEGEVTNEP